MKTRFTLVAVFFVIFLYSCGSKDTAQPASETTVAATVAVSALKDYPAVYSFSGKLETEKQSDLSTRMMGQISRVHAEPGQKVKRGDLLLQIRNQDILAKKAQVEASKIEAETAFESARKDMKRFEVLYETNSVSEKEMDDMRTHFQMAQARLNAVKEMGKEVDESLRYTSILAPYDGVITGKFIQEGDMANPGQPLLSIENPSTWKVTTRIPEADIARLRLNDPVSVQLKALGLELQGHIADINPSAAGTGNQFEAKILLSPRKELASQLYSGMYATVNYSHGLQSLLLVPAKALIHRGQLTGLYAVNDNKKALLRWIKTGKSFGDSIEILSGLSDGEKYIQSCEGKLVDGVLIENN